MVETVIILLVIAVYFRLSYEMGELKKFTGERIHDSEMWLFKSLYTINSNVVLPDEVDRKLSEIPAVVVNIGDDGEDEFDGKRDDWHG